MIECFQQLADMHGYKSSWSTQWLQSDPTLTAHRLLNIDLQQTKTDVDSRMLFFCEYDLLLVEQQLAVVYQHLTPLS